MMSHFVQQLEKELQLPGTIDSQVPGVYSFSLDGQSTVSMTDSSPGFHFISIIGPLPAERLEQFYSRMMFGNLFGKATHNAVLGIDEMGKNCIAQLHFAQNATYRDFADELEDFLNVVDFWKAELKTHNEAPTGSKPSIL